VYAAHDVIEVRDLPEPAPGPGEVLVRVAAAGICGSELEAFATRSPRRPPPLVMGHEFCGEVTALGTGVDGVQVGDRVVMNSLITCGTCEACREARPHLCPRREAFGMRRPGGFAERCAVPATTVFPLPEKVSPLEGALVEPLANAVHVWAMVEERLPETVVILGAGTIGLMCLQVARAVGAFRLVAVDPSPARLEVAHALGAEPVINPRETPLRDAIRAFTRGRGADVVVDAAGTPDSRRDAVGIARPGGTVVWIGLHADDTALSGAEVVLGERRVQGSYAVTAADLRKAIGLFAHRRVDIAPWARPFPLVEGARVFRELLTQPPEYVKAILLP
jgi:threonine dehydrogenase-like Zn-dependent dehydrogenase